MTQLILIFSILILSFHENTNAEKIDSSFNKETIVDLFKNFGDLTDSIKTVLLKNGEYYPTSNTDEDIEVIEMTVDSSNNTMAIKMYYKQGGNGAITITEYKSLETKRGIKFFRSTYAGTGAFTSQDRFEVYNYDITTKTFKLLTDNNKLALFKVEINDFFLAETPDSIIQEYKSHSSNYFVLSNCLNGITKNILVDNLIFNNTKDNKWIRGDAIKFDLKGDKFTRSSPYYESDY